MYEFTDDNWVETAFLDDTIVATFLLTLNKDPSSSSTLFPPFNVHWTVRQRRSNTRSRTAKIKAESRRASPTTPLSWSAATSGSGAAATTTDGNEESSRFNKSVHTSRSKIDEQSEANANKRSRKKRSRPELLEEEKLLLTERGTLKDKLACMHLTVEKQRANNESLKKMKLDLVSENTTKKARTSLVFEKAVLDPSQLVEANCDSSKLVQFEKESLVITGTANASSSSKQEVNNRKSSFLLPDQAANCGSSKLVQPQRVQEKELPVITANASTSSSSQQEINNRKPFLLPDLNLPLEEEFNFDF